MSAAPRSITFVVPGQEAGVSRGGPAEAPLPQGTVTQSVRVGAARGAAANVDVTAVPDRDVVVLEIANGPQLVLHPEHARDLMLAQGGTPRGTRGLDEGRVAVPMRLQWRGLERGGQSRGASRGILGDVTLSAVHVVSDFLKGPAAGWTAAQIVRKFDGQVDAGVYQLSADTLPALKGRALAKVAAAADPMLVFIHGTFSDTSGTFGKLWTNHPERVRRLFDVKNYGERVYALDHPTLGASPIANAVTLAEALPKNARLHLVTHSRGGLVAEVLAHVCANAGGDRSPFKGGAYAGQRAEIDALMALVAAKHITVERMVRVACPARGTLLASKRLDAYLSVFKWALKLAGVPVAPALVEFLGAVAQRRTDPAEIPGLAAQMPESPLIQWLHSVDRRVDGQLRVIAGDLEGDSVTSWLKTLLADAFYWTDNDLVVQTRSMYGGGPRATDASFLLDAGGGVSHFNYFANERTADAVVTALTQDEPQGFRTIGPLSWAGTSATGVRAAPATARQQREKPAVFLLPGILGSNLKAGDERIWLGWRLINGLDRLAYPGAKNVAADGPIALVYDDLIAFLSTTHEVIPFAFDWRVPIEEEARRLAGLVEQALDARPKPVRPGDTQPPAVRMIAHSMGGLVARAMQCDAKARPIWDRMMKHPQARLLMLGTPNGGSWAPMQVLSGDDTFGNTLVAAGAPFHGHDARALMARFPGFLQLQAGLLDTKLGLDQAAAWQKLADDDLDSVRRHNWWHNLVVQQKAIEWGVPPQAALDAAVALRKQFDDQREHALASFADKLLLVTGRAPFTPDGYEQTPDGLVYLNAPEDGDGRVTRESAMLPGVRAWTVDADHGSLPSRKTAFAAYRELLENGTTTLLQALPGAVRGLATEAPPVRLRSRPSREALSLPPVQDEQELLTAGVAEPADASASPTGTALRITVHNGDLTFIPHPIMLGHYRASSKLTGTEAVMDRRVGNAAMSRALKAGEYPDNPGTHKIFRNTSVNAEYPWHLPRPKAVIVVGLGQEGNLKGTDIVTTVRQGVMAWAHRLAEDPDAPSFFELATTLLGSGGVGVTARQAAQLIAEGVREANERLDDEPEPARRPWPRVGHLHIIELYLERASEALGALKLQASAAPGRFVVGETIEIGTGPMRRPVDAGYRGAPYDYVSVVMKGDDVGNSIIDYTLDTKRARSEVRAQQTQRKLITSLLSGSSIELAADPQIGRTLFQLLVPIELEPYLTGTTDLQIELDGGTAGIPWELLDTDVNGRRESHPWAIRVKLLRKLRLLEYRELVIDADAASSALVIGEPATPADYPRLDGARLEARAVAACLGEAEALGGDRVKALVSPDDPAMTGPDARAVLNALMERDWRIVHVAGHGEPPEMRGKEPETPGDPPQTVGNPRGVVLSDGCFLGPREIRSLRRVPELVFVNCCHLARDGNEPLRKNHSRFAAGVAGALIEIGVRCVVAAGWAVDDRAASVFARTFYTSLLRDRQRFIDAVAQAREAAWALGGNTWAAYQCYGDPDWTFRQDVADAQKPTPPADEFSGVTSPAALQIALETLAVQSEFQGASAAKQRDKIRYLADRFGAKWRHIGRVAETFGTALVKAGDVPGAIDWYEDAVQANDGSASMRAAEQLGNLRVRQARGTPAQRRAAIGKALEDLERVSAVEPTMERESLCASAYKRLALLERDAKRPAAMLAAIRKMEDHYRRAQALAVERDEADRFYPAMNLVAAELAVNPGARRDRKSAAPPIADIRKHLEGKKRDAPDFWSVVGLIELEIYEAIRAGKLTGHLERVEHALDDLHGRVPTPWMWGSVYDTASLVLPAYAARARGDEKAAARTLLTSLKKRAG